MPERPVLIVKAFGFTAVTVADPPKDIELPFTVTEELVNDVLAIFVSVLLVPDIVLFDNVSVPATVAKSASLSAVLNSAIVPESVFVASDIDLLLRVSVLFVVATTVVSTFKVTVPLVPPPVKPVPAVTPSMSPAIDMLPPRATGVPLIVIPELESLSFAIEPASIVFVTVPVSPVVIIVPVLSGIVIVRSSVGSTEIRVV